MRLHSEWVRLMKELKRAQYDTILRYQFRNIFPSKARLSSGVVSLPQLTLLPDVPPCSNSITHSHTLSFRPALMTAELIRWETPGRRWWRLSEEWKPTAVSFFLTGNTMPPLLSEERARNYAKGVVDETMPESGIFLR